MRTGRPRTGKMLQCQHCAKLVYRHPCNFGKSFCSLKCRDAAKRAKRVNETEGTARCAKCREWKPIKDFVKGQGNRPHSYCKPCSADWFAEYRGIEPEKRVPYRPTYRLTEEQKKQNKRQANHMQHQARRAGGKAPCKYEIGKMLCLQDARCAYCNRLLDGAYHIDHKQPVSRGGTNAIENLHLACPTCNMRKGAMTHDEFLASKRRPVTNWANSK